MPKPLRRPATSPPRPAPPPSVPSRAAATGAADDTPRLQRPATDAASRRQTILLAAEKLFAQRGYHAVSMRDIAGEASVPVALVSYHYGSKQELYHAIFESWQPVIRRRRELLEEAMGADHTPTLESILAAFIAPLAALNRDPAGQYFAKMAARDLASPTPESEQAQREFFDPMANAFIDALHQLFPQRSRADVAWCYQFMLGAVLHHLSDVRIERLSQGTAMACDPRQEPMLVAFVAAGIRGTLGEPQAARMDSPRRRTTR